MASLATDGYCHTAMPLLRRNELDAAMAVLVVVPIHKCGNPLAGLLFVAEWPAGVIRPRVDSKFSKESIAVVAAPSPVTL